MKIIISIFISFFITACSSILDDDIDKKLEAVNFNKTYIARFYINMWGGAAGGIDYFVNIQKVDEKPNTSKNVVFKSSDNMITICLKWTNNNKLNIITDAHRYKFSQLNRDIKVEILYSTSKKDFMKYKICYR